MRPILILQPFQNNSADILRCFAEGKPLSSDQRNYLDWHQKQLSSPEFDPVYKYYIESIKREHRESSSFLMPTDVFNFASVQQFKKRLKMLLVNRLSGVAVHFTQKQLMQFNQVSTSELIFWHGNQFLTGAPFFPGGTPPVIFFQWGNLFGVVKYVIMAGDKTLKSNVLVYFEDMQERNLDQCVADYQRKLNEELAHQNIVLQEHKIDPAPLNEFIIKTPKLTLDPMKRI
jgi:hypothetical protein